MYHDLPLNITENLTTMVSHSKCIKKDYKVVFFHNDSDICEI